MIKAVSVVIPAYREEGAIAGVVEELKRTLEAARLEAEIIVVDDGSEDATGAQAAGAGAVVLRHRSNRGYGAALKSGIAAAKHDVCAITDADGTYPAKYIPEMLTQLDAADMVIGARTGGNVHIPLVRRPAKWVLNRLANFVAQANIVDLNSGLRVFRRDMAMQYFAILPDQFSWTSTLTLAMHCDKYAVRYTPIDYLERTGKSKIVPWDAATFAVLILRTAMLFRPLRVFLPLVVFCFGFGTAKLVLDLVIKKDATVSISCMLALLSGLLILLMGMLGDAIATRLGRFNANGTAAARGVDVSPLEPERGQGAS
jgi:glycosyltransferase involved in cell wall biosynthesis